MIRVSLEKPISDENRDVKFVANESKLPEISY